ncbi:hypothetical protein OROGR_017670 [Orobanche gracilis]
MPQGDLEALVTQRADGVSDGKISGGTLADNYPPENDVIPDGDAAAELQSDFPPESFWLSKDEEHDWFSSRNAFYEREDSTRGISNSTNLNSQINPSSNNSNSQRFSVNLKSKASIIGLPKTQKTTSADVKPRMCKPANMRLFPKRSVSVGKSTTPVEPGSPNVSCMGRVRSKRSRRRSNSRRRIENPAEISRTGVPKQKRGFCSKVLGMFRGKKSHRKPSRSGSRKVAEILVVEPVGAEPLRQRKNVSLKVREFSSTDETVAEPPGLGGMTRFASGRRSGSWTSEDFNKAVSGELDRPVDRIGNGEKSYVGR